ncbi:hypothetical protein BY458DRAFT_510754 [Sporodiniella umbellata]|nr:hypothetical protein BY458DRAFT_510754 [Sporodiniella umbellata]
MFKFWSDWKRKGTMETKDETNSLARTCSSTSTPSDWSIDWSEPKRALSFKEDYVSFPSLEPTHSDITSYSS